MMQPHVTDAVFSKISTDVIRLDRLLTDSFKIVDNETENVFPEPVFRLTKDMITNLIRFHEEYREHTESRTDSNSNIFMKDITEMLVKFLYLLEESIMEWVRVGPRREWDDVDFLDIYDSFDLNIVVPGVDESKYREIKHFCKYMEDIHINAFYIAVEEFFDNHEPIIKEFENENSFPWFKVLNSTLHDRLERLEKKVTRMERLGKEDTSECRDAVESKYRLYFQYIGIPAFFYALKNYQKHVKKVVDDKK